MVIAVDNLLTSPGVRSGVGGERSATFLTLHRMLKVARLKLPGYKAEQPSVDEQL
jgi:hypothetical protein